MLMARRSETKSAEMSCRRAAAGRAHRYRDPLLQKMKTKQAEVGTIRSQAGKLSTRSQGLASTNSSLEFAYKMDFDNHPTADLDPQMIDQPDVLAPPLYPDVPDAVAPPPAAPPASDDDDDDDNAGGLFGDDDDDE